MAYMNVNHQGDDGRTWSVTKVATVDNGDGTYSIAADTAMMAELAAIKGLLTDIKALLSDPLDVKII